MAASWIHTGCTMKVPHTAAESAKGKELCTDVDLLLESHTRACLSLSFSTGTIGTCGWCEATGVPQLVTL